MADMIATPARPGLTPIIWQDTFWTEYMRENQFAPYFGTDMNSMIQLQTDLTRKNGDTVVFATVRNLVGAGVTGNTVLEGNEEILNDRSLNVPVSVIRHGVPSRSGTRRNPSSTCCRRCRSEEQVPNKFRSDIITSQGRSPLTATCRSTTQAQWSAQHLADQQRDNAFRHQHRKRGCRRIRYSAGHVDNMWTR
jgi:hypothetical protein